VVGNTGKYNLDSEVKYICQVRRILEPFASTYPWFSLFTVNKLDTLPHEMKSRGLDISREYRVVEVTKSYRVFEVRPPRGQWTIEAE
jgi:hypothetical protein